MLLSYNLITKSKSRISIVNVEQMSKQEQKHCLIARSRLNVNPNLTKENECILLALNITVSKLYVNRAKKNSTYFLLYA